MQKETPLGMRIGESVFCVGYLVFAFAAGSIFTARANASGNMQAGLQWVLLAVMTFLLACGDTFHLVPRVLRNIAGKGAGENTDAFTFWLGLGNLISSITMTLFYNLLFLAVYARTHDRLTDMADDRFYITVFNLLLVFSVIRIIMCLFPQNEWFSQTHNLKWGIIRNTPFFIVGIITVAYLFHTYQLFHGEYLLLALLVGMSFICYMLVVLYAGRKPAMGMFMIPKTVCYIWMISFFL